VNDPDSDEKDRLIHLFAISLIFQFLVLALPLLLQSLSLYLFRAAS
jgi:hypothetical protein